MCGDSAVFYLTKKLIRGLIPRCSISQGSGFYAGLNQSEDLIPRCSITQGSGFYTGLNKPYSTLSSLILED